MSQLALESAPWRAARPQVRGVVAQDRAWMARELEPLAPMLAGSNVLITGALGMLPSYMVHAICALNEGPLADDPCHVLALTRRPGDSPLLAEPWIDWLVQDAREPIPWDVRYDYAIVAASAASPQSYLSDPVGTLQANAVGLDRVLSRAKMVGLRSALFVSSGEIYGSPPPEHCPTPESYVAAHDPLSPRACYVEGKRYGEALAMAYQRAQGVDCRIVRPFQVFGPGMRLDDGRAFADFVGAASRGEPLVLRSAGSALRTYCYIADATVAFFKALLLGSPGSVYNVGAQGPELSILELARLVARAAGGDSRVVFAGEDEVGAGSPARTCPEIAKIQSELGWAPSTSLEEGLRRTLAWLKEEER